MTASAELVRVHFHERGTAGLFEPQVDVLLAELGLVVADDCLHERGDIRAATAQRGGISLVLTGQSPRDATSLLILRISS